MGLFSFLSGKKDQSSTSTRSRPSPDAGEPGTEWPKLRRAAAPTPIAPEPERPSPTFAPPAGSGWDSTFTAPEAWDTGALTAPMETPAAGRAGGRPGRSGGDRRVAGADRRGDEDRLRPRDSGRYLRARPDLRDHRRPRTPRAREDDADQSRVPVRAADCRAKSATRSRPCRRHQRVGRDRLGAAVERRTGCRRRPSCRWVSSDVRT